MEKNAPGKDKDSKLLDFSLSDVQPVNKHSTFDFKYASLPIQNGEALNTIFRRGRKRYGQNR
jgi:hypothetical protein